MTQNSAVSPSASSDSADTKATMSLETFIDRLLAYEKEREDRCSRQFARNRSYWRELRGLHGESLEDMKAVANYLRAKASTLKRTASALRSESGAHGAQPFAHAKLKRHSIGASVCGQLDDLDASCAKHLLQAATSIEQEISPLLEEKIENMEREVQQLWRRGKFLLLVSVVMEARVQNQARALRGYFTQRDGGQGGAASSPPLADSPADAWLLSAQYCAAARRSLQLFDEMNRQFRALFLCSKDLEATRVNFVAKISENVALQLMECWQGGLLACKNAHDNLKEMPSILSQPSLGEELSQRVSEEFSVTAPWSSSHGPHDETENNANTDDSEEVSTMIQQIHLPISVPTEKRVFLCAVEEAGLILSSWQPVLVVFTSDSWLHLFRLEKDTSYDNAWASLSVADEYSQIVKREKLFFESDWENFVRNTAGGEKEMERDRKVASHPELQRLMDNVSVKDLEEKPKDDLLKFIEPTISLDPLLRPLLSLNERKCTAHMTPSQIENENLITVTESSLSDSWFSLWSSTVERKVTLKTRNQLDAVELISLFKNYR